MNNTAQTSVSALTSFVQGSSWPVTYYQQVLGADNELAAHDVNRPAAYQQYRKLQDLELMVTSPLQHSQDTQSKEFEVTGSAIAYGFLKPNAGDTFIAPVDNGRLAIFNVVRSEKTTYMASANYQIDYKLTAYADAVLVTDLDKKSVETFQFVKSLLSEGQYPLMALEAYALYGGLSNLFTDLASLYFRDFFSVQRQTLLVPDQSLDTYDHFLTKAVVDLVATEETADLPKIRLPAVEGDLIMTNVTCWDALLRTNKSLLVTGIQRAGLVSTLVFRNFPHLTGIYFTGISTLVYPRDPRTDIDATYNNDINAVSISPYIGDGTPRYQSLERVLRDQDNTFFATDCACVEEGGDTLQLPAIVPVTQDDYYVFTKGFYGVRNALLSSQLEVMARQAITQRPLSREQLTQLGQAAFTWPNLERFYYIPVILALIRISLRST